MKKLLMTVLCAAFVVGCTTTARTRYNTLATVQATTSKAVEGYFDLVIKGKLPTNNVPRVTKAYDTYLVIWGAAVDVAQWNTNTAAPTAVTTASSAVLKEVAGAQ